MRKRTVGSPRFLSAAVIPLALVVFPGRSAAQDASAHCPVVLHLTAPAVRDSLLQSLDPGEIALTGFVRDEATGAPVSRLVVRIEGSRLGTTTSEDGGYLIRHANRAEGVPARPMVRVCEPGGEYLIEIREARLVTPWDGTVVVIDGTPVSSPGYAVRLDFVVRRRPNVF